MFFAVVAPGLYRLRLSKGRDLLAVYTAAIFISSTLLFLIQPMFAKMVLPLLGGTPAVWNTCMVFFQTMLLAGYLYAHLTTKLLGARRQAVLHLLVLLLPIVSLPIAVQKGWAPPADVNPIPSLLWMLCISVGLPFFALSTTNPLLQNWFSETGHSSSRDPYFLYAASNVGSMLALLLYPAAIEPFLPVAWQAASWSWGYGLLVLSIAGCALALWMSPGPGPVAQTVNAYPDGELGDRVDWKRRLRWIALAFAPSSMMIGATTYIATDVASFPLLWIVPLAIYLFSFIVVFAKRPWWPHSLSVMLFPIIALLLALVMALVTQHTDIRMIAMHLLGLFIASMYCHGELVKDRPSTKHLTEYYLLMSLGGNLGGIFNSLIAPLAFNSVLEYPLAIVAACMLRRPKSNSTESTPAQKRNDILYPLAMLAILSGLVLVLPSPKSGQVQYAELARMAGFAVATVVCVGFLDRRCRFALAIGAMLMVRPLTERFDGETLLVERSFFGVVRIQTGGPGKYAEFRRMLHGTTMHGMQQKDPANACSLSTYYHPLGPLGSVLTAHGTPARSPRVAIVGLGTGCLGAYRQAGQDFDIYEIDPAVRRIAEDPKYFTYLSDCCAKAGKPGGYRIILGDGRLKLADAPDGHYGVIVLDAFSSDAVPMHLMTREALALYLRKLAPGGVIAFHVSNRVLILPPVVAALAKDAGVRAYLCEDNYDDINPNDGDTPAEKAIKEKALADGRFASEVVVVVRKPADLGDLAKQVRKLPNEEAAKDKEGDQPDPQTAVKTEARWQDITDQAKRRPWTDDFSNLLETIRW